MLEPIDKLKAEFFKTLGHPARIRILELLAEGEHSVGELMPRLGLESSHLSQQLAVLRRTGMVVARKQGNTVIYSMASKDMAGLLLLARKILTGLLTDQMSLLKDLQGQPPDDDPSAVRMNPASMSGAAITSYPGRDQ